MSTLKKITLERMNREPNTVATNNQRRMFEAKPSCAVALRQMIDGVETYCLNYSKEMVDSPIVGDDHYIGPEVENILRALHALLAGPGIFSANTCSSAICEIATITAKLLNSMSSTA